MRDSEVDKLEKYLAEKAKQAQAKESAKAEARKKIPDGDWFY